MRAKIIIVSVAILGLFIALFSLMVIPSIVQNIRNKQVVSDVNRELTEQPLTVQGKMPDWLAGTFVRNGPVSVKVNDKEIPHWFDGLAMLHAFHFKNNQVIYSNKFLRSDPYREVFERGNIYFGGFATASKKTFLEKIRSFINQSRVRTYKMPMLM